MIKTPILILSLAASACATLTEEQLYEREQRLLEAIDNYNIRAEHCRRIGGVMIFERRFSRAGRKTYREYEEARCVSRLF